ncbi:hypothetical protein ABGB12_30375 [Actinocorallia sp. B10E7]|uniref:hypothetical protein n=1 Tax=Actinocorallia sp. B10E7 TaxID=3153558 RepID=UPI00325EBA50
MTDYLLALAVDHLAIGNWLFTTAHTDNDPSDPPEPLPRPTAPDTTSRPPADTGRQEATPAELTAFFTG